MAWSKRDEVIKLKHSYWLDVLQHNARRWRPPFDDPAVMLQAGLDLPQWVEAGLQTNEP
jgi:hypothetical protein